MRLSPLVALTGALLATACGPQKRLPSEAFEKVAEECVADVVPNRYIVKYLDGRVESVLDGDEATFINGFLTKNLDQIEFAEPEIRVRSQAIHVHSEAYVDNWGQQRIHADALWSQGIKGAGVAVAVVDSGMDLSHSKLRKQVMSNPGEQGIDNQGRDKSSNHVDDDKNGLIDDALGYDFVANQPLSGDYDVHGTHVAGIIAAQHDDSVAQPTGYVQGTAPQAKILPLAFLDGKSGLMSDGVRAIKYAVDRGVKVINASWGGTVCSRSLRDTVNSLTDKNVLFVAAAGNSAKNIDRVREYPASFDFPAMITVGATGLNDYLAEFSNYGLKSVHLFAPGVDIVSTIPGERVGGLSGTSMAAPFVAGAAALLFSAEPQATVQQVRQALFVSAAKSSQYLNATQGRMDLSQALAELRRQMGR